MDTRVTNAMKWKRTLLFVEMLHSIHFPSAKELGHYLSSGFPIAGPFPPTGVFPARVKRADLNVNDLWAMATDIRATVISACQPSGDDSLDQQLIDITNEEVQKGWLEGAL